MIKQIFVDLSKEDPSVEVESEVCKECGALKIKINESSDLEEDYDSEVSGQAKEDLT